MISMGRRQVLGGALGCVGALALEGQARADAVDDALKEMTQARAGVKTLLAPFTQKRAIGLLATEVESAGEMTLVLPDRLRWELKPPDAVTYWVTPEGFGYATPKGGGATGASAAGRFGAVLGDLLILLGGDLAKLRSRYDIAIPSRKDGLTLSAKPRAPEVAKLVTRLELSAGPELWSVKRVVIEEPGGDRSEITFGQVQRDAKVDPARMKPPRP
ncbi:LolA family protein [Chondromyces apiculatus]|uniref:Outer membrane lipoprotein carrier protein LolA n=1 Tax=Chondromyces apiculatus DSM 436 TaxID=1192034 RepID=A0A017T0L2_9BACT|nr:outer-membrane lipoprotein carrier protein LolA [Chondromyces apiculatus]EYF02522.1 Hypothetical protein CAP_6729 [Chondromyces apiculatus DSM 436]